LKEKRNHTWCELWHDSRLGVREGCDYLTGLLDLELDSRSSVWCVSYNSKSGVREGCGWLASLKMKMEWERGVAGYGWRRINLISLQICEWKCELCGLRERLRSKEKDGWSLDARVKNKNVFFFYSTPLTEPVWFGWGFSGFRFLKPKPNRKFFKRF